MAKSEKPRPSPRKFTFSEIKPWPDPVAGSSLVASLVDTFASFLVAPPFAVETMALWVMFSHTFQAWQSSPRLVFTSSRPECGKTTALTLLSWVVPKPLPTVNITPAALFRIMEKESPTLLIDEADTFIEGNEEMRGVLNSGHTKGTAFVWRCHPETMEPEAFSTWAPIAIAKIGGLPDTLRSRSLIVPLQRKRPDQPRLHLLDADRRLMAELASKASRWASDHVEELRESRPDMPHTLGNRLADNWRPLVGVADAVGGPFPRLARRAALASASVADASDPLEAVVAFVRSRGGAVPEHILRQHLHRAMKPEDIDTAVQSLISEGRLKLENPGAKPGMRNFLPPEAK